MLVCVVKGILTMGKTADRILTAATNLSVGIVSEAEAAFLDIPETRSFFGSTFLQIISDCLDSWYQRLVDIRFLRMRLQYLMT